MDGFIPLFETIKFITMRTLIFFATMILSSHVTAQWDVTTSKDEMTGEISSYCSSPITAPTKIMSFPYGDTKGWLGIGCDGESEWVYAGFTNAPNLQDTEIGDGYNKIKTRIKFDDEVQDVYMSQKWNSKFIHFYDVGVIDKIMKANTILLELDWYGEGNVYFRFSGAGSTKAINQIRASCL